MVGGQSRGRRTEEFSSGHAELIALMDHQWKLDTAYSCDFVISPVIIIRKDPKKPCDKTCSCCGAGAHRKSFEAEVRLPPVLR